MNNSLPLFKVDWKYIRGMAYPVKGSSVITVEDIQQCPVNLNDPDKLNILFKELIANRIEGEGMIPDFVYIEHVEDLR